MTLSEIQDIVVKDIEKRRLPSKHYAYIIEVQWSDGKNTMIGRQYSAFFDFQMSLLEKFPEEAGQKDPTKRLIPFLPGKILFRRSNTRDVALKRLGPIAEYCTGIAKMPPHISGSEIVLEFFRTAVEDQEIGRKLSTTSEQAPGTKTANEITGPISLDKFVAIAEYKADNKKELSLKEGDIVEVVEKKENGWWLAANEEGMNGWVPGVYLESLYGEKASPPKKRAKPGEGEMYDSICHFEATSSDELSFAEHDLLEILEKNLEGWWYARKDDTEGWVPATYLQKSSSSPNPQAPFVSKPGFDARSHWRKSLDKVKKPPPKRSTVRRTLSKDAVTKAQISFKAKMKKQEVITEEEEDDEEFAGIYETIDAFESTIPDGISFQNKQTVRVIQKSDEGWWYGSIGDKRGWVPESYLKETTPGIMPRSPSPFANIKAKGPYENASTKPPRPTRPPSKNKFLNTPSNQNYQNSANGPPQLGNLVDLIKQNKTNKQEVRRSPSPLPQKLVSPKKNLGMKPNIQIDLTDYEWYRNITRQEAESALLAEGQEGYFIIRPSKRGSAQGKPYSLTLFHQNVVWNFHIRLRTDKKYAIGVFKEIEPCFYALSELIDHYKQSPMIIGEEERKVKLIDSPSELYAAC